MFEVYHDNRPNNLFVEFDYNLEATTRRKPMPTFSWKLLLRAAGAAGGASRVGWVRVLPGQHPKASRDTHTLIDYFYWRGCHANMTGGT